MWSAMMTVMMEMMLPTKRMATVTLIGTHILIKCYCKIIMELFLYYSVVCDVVFVANLLAYLSI